MPANSWVGSARVWDGPVSGLGQGVSQSHRDPARLRGTARGRCGGVRPAGGSASASAAVVVVDDGPAATGALTWYEKRIARVSFSDTDEGWQKVWRASIDAVDEHVVAHRTALPGAQALRGRAGHPADIETERADRRGLHPPGHGHAGHDAEPDQDGARDSRHLRRGDQLGAGDRTRRGSGRGVRVPGRRPSGVSISCPASAGRSREPWATRALGRWERRRCATSSTGPRLRPRV